MEIRVGKGPEQDVLVWKHFFGPYYDTNAKHSNIY